MRTLKVMTAVCLLSLAVSAADSPFSGTWKLNLSKSKLAFADKTISDVLHIRADENGLKYAEENIDDTGTHKISVEAKFDGKDYPVKGDPLSDTVAYQRSGDALLITLKKDAKVVAKSKVVVSKDGQTSTVHYTIYGEKPQIGVAVYDRQKD